MEIRQVNVEVKDKPNSFEFGPVGKRHKVYYGDFEELKKKIQESIAAEKLLETLKQTEGGEK